MLVEYETFENLMKLSISDLMALLPLSGTYEEGYKKLVSQAIDKKIQDILVQKPPY